MTTSPIAATVRDRASTVRDWPGKPPARHRADTPPKVGPRALDRLLRRTPRSTP